jgi:hypothetical protein
MKRFYFLLSCIIAAAAVGCSSIDVAISHKVDVNKKFKKIAVFPFDIAGTHWGGEFSDSITHHFFKTGKIEVVERDALNKIMKEQNLSMTGLIDDTNAVKVGKLLGADVIVIGRGTMLKKHQKSGDEMNMIDTFTLKAINVETGAMLITVRKEPGSAWNWKYRMKFLCSLSLIWDRQDILVESSKYDQIAQQIVQKILEAIDEIEKQKNISQSGGKK